MLPNRKTKLYQFVYRGKNLQGKIMCGEILSASKQLAKLQLRQQGIMPLSINRPSLIITILQYKPITSAHITAFARQLTTLLQAGIPMVDSLTIMIKSSTHSRVIKLITYLRDEIETGKKLGEVLNAYPRYFNPLFCSLIKVGEESGTLAIMLERVALYQEKNETLKRKIKKALFYPSAVIIAAVGVSIVLLVKVVPQFETLFNNFGAKLPAFTRLVLSLSTTLQQSWLWYSSIGMIFLCLFIGAKRTIPTVAFWVDKASLKLPIFGKLLVMSIIARFARTLAISFVAGLPMVNALRLVAPTPNNLVYERALTHACQAISSGRQLHLVLRETHLFPALMLEMISIGEETGKIDQMLNRVAEDYEEKVDTMVDGLSSLLEPLIMGFIGVIVGGLVIAMYLPIFQMGSVF